MNKKMHLITTSYRGVFVGFIADRPATDRVIMDDVRCVIYWGTTNGLLQLCETGATDTTQLSSVCPRAEFLGVTGVFEVSSDAAKTFRKATE